MASTMTTLVRAMPLRAAPLVARRRAAVAVPARRLLMTTRAEAQQDKPATTGGESSAVAPQSQGERGMMAPRSFEMMAPWSRMNQMLRSMEEEMNVMSRAFGMPSLMPSLSSSLFDLPATAAADFPVTAKSLAVDIKDTGKDLEIVADVPGLKKEDIKIQVSPDRVLTISGERKSEQREGSEEEGNLRIERSYGTFMRRFRLPEATDLEGIKANVKDGVLKLVVPKTEAAQPKQIEVNVSEE